ncbi:right-handed parallel beta-helix repeat-containing protein [Kitasatospora purpeofusca]|uniref:right-handed parallel beta-helix repeat-containing protein n=1 Tax=Kitasatospora purpeofusca TaxID=67352 RepID=UPI0035DB260F
MSTADKNLWGDSLDKRAFAGLAAVAVVGLGVVAPAEAVAADRTTLYVDQNSCAPHPDGSAMYPFCTIQAAADAVQPGQTVLVTGGVYRERVTVRRSGTPDRPIVFAAGAPGTYNTGVLLTSPYQAAGTETGFLFSGVHDVELRKFTFSGLGTAVAADASTRVRIADSTFHPELLNGMPSRPQVSVRNSSEDVAVQQNDFDYAPFGGIEVASGSRGTLVTANRIEHTDGTGIAVVDAPGTKITNNDVTGACGNSIALTGASSGSLVENNIVAKVRPGADPAVCPAGSSPAEIAVADAAAEGLTLDYNIVHADAGTPAYRWSGTAYSTAAELRAATGQGAHEYHGDPQLGLDGTPLAGSPALDSGDPTAPWAGSDRWQRPEADNPLVSSPAGQGPRDRGALEMQAVDHFGFEPTVLAGAAPLAVSLTPKPVLNWPTELSYRFDFGDGSPAGSSTGQTVNHVYTRPGTEPNITVTATAPNGHRVTGRAQAHVRYPAGGYVAVPPARVLDTRTGLGSGSAAPLGHGEQKNLTVPGIPAGATAVVLNLTAVTPTDSGHLDVWPAGDPAPGTSNLNFTPGQIVSNLVTVPVNADGTVTLRNSAGATDVVADLSGYYRPNDGSRFTAMLPQRLVDTRDTGSPLGGGEVLSVQVGGNAGVPSSATAAVLNITATEGQRDSFLTAHASGTPRPDTSNVNYAAGRTVPNQVIVPIGADGRVAIDNNDGSTHVVVDIAGYYDTYGADLFTPVRPARLLDTRQSYPGVIGPDQSKPVSLSPGLDGGVNPDAIVLNVTAVQPTTDTHLSVWSGVRTIASNVNVVRGGVAANHVTTRVDARGGFNLYNHAGSTHAVADLFGYFSKD